MIIGFDARKALRNNTGLGNYSRKIIDVLSDYYPENSYLLYGTAKKMTDRIQPLLHKPNISLCGPKSAFANRFPSAWRLFSGLKNQLIRDKVDVYHGLSNELPLNISKSGIPTVVTIHDLIFRIIKDGYKTVDRHIYDFKFRHAAENADRIIAVSQRTAADLVKFYNINPEKITVIYQGCDPAFLKPVDDNITHRIKELYNLPDRYIVMVGTVEPRKNQLLAIEALKKLPDDIKLVIVGKLSRPYSDRVNETISVKGLADRVIRIENAPFSHLPSLYKMADVSAYPSRYEGFGIPIVESIASGTPVIAATGSCLEEAGGPGAIYISPDNPSAFAEAALEIIENKDVRQRLVTEGQSWINRNTPEKIAEETMRVYYEAIAAK